MKKLLFIVSILLLVVSCKTSEEKEKTYKTSLIKGVATPIYMDSLTVDVLMADYFLDVTKIDSVANTNVYSVTLTNNDSIAHIEVSENVPAIFNLRIWAAGIPNDIPIFKSNKKTVDISVPSEGKSWKKLEIKGEFSNWEIKPMQLIDGNWTYTTTVVPGDHQYVLLADGNEMQDPSNPKTIGNGMGGTNSLISIPTNEEKLPFLDTKEVTDNGFTFSSENPVDTILAYLDDQLIASENIKNKNGVYSVEIPKTDSERAEVRVYASNEFGRSNDLLVPLEHGKVITDVAKLKRTDYQTQVMYFLMVDRFKDGDLSNTKKVKSDSVLDKVNYYGGDLQGVLDKINDGYFTELGINTIWLSPITQNPEGAYGLWKDPMTKFSGYHGYWPVSNTKIDYRFGNEQVFEELIAAAHKKNMNVILDYVANHVHEENPIYKEHPDWATDLYLPDGTMNTERWDDHRLTTWFDTFMPTLDFSKPEVVEKMTDSAAFWVTHYDLDGFRHDATKHIQQEFWRMLTKKVKERTDRPIYQIGETYGSPQLIRSYINTGMLDAQFDFNLYDTSVQAFATDAPFERLSKQLKQGLDYYGSHNLMGNISGNQDRARFISYASGDVRFDEDAKKAGWTRDIKMSDTTAYNKLAMLQAFNLTIPGIPCIYYGDEYGSIGGNDPDNRKVMKFEKLDDNEKRLKNQITELVHKRRNSMALQYGTTEVLKAENGVLVILRKYFDDTVTILFNKSAEAITFEGTQVPPNNFAMVEIRDNMKLREKNKLTEDTSGF